jgi:hypothetical protein
MKFFFFLVVLVLTCVLADREFETYKSFNIPKLVDFKIHIKVVEITEFSKYKVTYDIKGEAFSYKFSYYETIVLTSLAPLKEDAWVEIKRDHECSHISTQTNSINFKTLNVAYPKCHKCLVYAVTQYCTDGNTISQYAPQTVNGRLSKDKIELSVSYYIWYTIEIPLVSLKKKDEL